MSPRRCPLSLLLILAACLILGAGRTAAQPNPSSDLLLPYFEVGVLNEDVTTLFAVGNAAEEPVAVQATVYSNWGVPVLDSGWSLAPRQVRTFNLRDWLILGRLPDRDLSPEEVSHLQAALSGQRSPLDDLYYATEVVPGCALGSIILRTQGFRRPDALWGDFFLVEPDLVYAEAEDLVNLDPSVDHRPLCRRHALRFLEGGTFAAGTRLIVWTPRQGLPSPDPYYPEGQKTGCEMACFDEPGHLLDVHRTSILPLQVTPVSELAMAEPFGSIDLTTELESFITLRHSAFTYFSVMLRTWCLPEEEEPLPSAPRIRIEKSTNGEDADAPTGPVIPPGEPVRWEYVVTNTGDVSLTGIEVTDDQGVAVSCPENTLEPGESMVCTASGTAETCQYGNVGTVVGTAPEGEEVLDSDPSHYFGGGSAAVDVEKSTNGHDADEPPGPTLAEGAAVTWTYVVTNTGDVALTGITVVDDQGVAVSCPASSLAPVASMTCTAAGTTVAGQYGNLGTVTAEDECGETVSDSDPSHYYGECREEPGIDLEKATNGHDADSPPGPTLDEGDAVTWTYVVTNTGNVPLTGITVIDNQGVAVSCPASSLDPGQSMTCTGSGIAGLTSSLTKCLGHQYSNLGTATALTWCGHEISDSDPSHYHWDEEEPGGEGCTPGYWKNHTDSWTPTGYSQEQEVQSVFGDASGYPGLGSATLLEALDFGGGPGVDGAARILLRAAVAALLNASHPGVGYSLAEAQVVADVAAALASGDRDAMLVLASGLDSANNLGCPLN